MIYSTLGWVFFFWLAVEGLSSIVFRRSRPYHATTHRDNELVLSWYIIYMSVCARACVCVFCFNSRGQRMCCYIVMKGAWLSLPGALITSAHVTPFNNPESSPHLFRLCTLKMGASEIKSVCLYLCVYRMQFCAWKREKSGRDSDWKTEESLWLCER